MAQPAQRMAPADAVWLRGESRVNPMTISAVLWFDGRLDVGRLRGLLLDRLVRRHPVLRQRVVPSHVPGALPLRRPDPAFDLDRHLRVVELPGAGDHADLEARCSAERSTPLDRAHPPWALTVYQGYHGTGSAIHARLHHSLADGLALTRLILDLADERRGTPAAAAGHAGWSRVATRGHTVVAAGLEVVRHPSHLGERVHDGAGIGSWAVRLLVPTIVERSVLLGHPRGTKRMAWDPDGVPLVAVKDAAHAHGTTVNDLLLALLAGALHRYLDAHGDRASQALVMVPVDLRTPGAPLPRSLGNRIGLLPIRLPVGDGDLSARVATIRAQTSRLKGSPAPVASRAVLAATALVPPPVGRAIHRVNQVRSTGVVTNVRGPAAPLHLAGARLIGAVGWGGMTAHLNLSACFVTVGERIYAGLVADEAITPDPERLLRELRATYQEEVRTDRIRSRSRSG